jgi:hypothetical protein
MTRQEVEVLKFERLDVTNEENGVTFYHYYSFNLFNGLVRRTTRVEQDTNTSEELSPISTASVANCDNVDTVDSE